MNFNDVGDLGVMNRFGAIIAKHGIGPQTVHLLRKTNPKRGQLFG
jgi:hypothetical protein